MFLEGILKRYDQGIRLAIGKVCLVEYITVFLLFGYAGERLIPNLRRKGTMLCVCIIFLVSERRFSSLWLYVFGNSKIDDGF